MTTTEVYVFAILGGTAVLALFGALLWIAGVEAYDMARHWRRARQWRRQGLHGRAPRRRVRRGDGGRGDGLASVEGSAVAILVATADELGRLLAGRVRDPVSIFAIFASLHPTPDVLEELARAGAAIEAGEAAIYRTGCVEMHIQLAPATPAKEG